MTAWTKAEATTTQMMTKRAVLMGVQTETVAVTWTAVAVGAGAQTGGEHESLTEWLHPLKSWSMLVHDRRPRGGQGAESGHVLANRAVGSEHNGTPGTAAQQDGRVTKTITDGCTVQR